LKQLSLVLVVLGVLAALFGVSQEQWKAFLVGIVLIISSGVLATLYLGTRGPIE
jgi:hypothetical protein